MDEEKRREREGEGKRRKGEEARKTGGPFSVAQTKRAARESGKAWFFLGGEESDEEEEKGECVAASERVVRITRGSRSRTPTRGLLHDDDS